MLFIKKEIEVQIEFPRIVYLKVQPKWNGSDYLKITPTRVESVEEYKALKGEYVLNYKEVTNSVKPKKAPAKKQPKLEV
jgi:hypothetical protein